MKIKIDDIEIKAKSDEAILILLQQILRELEALRRCQERAHPGVM